MAKSISEQDVRQAVSKVKHPAIDRTLIELGVLKDITIRNDKVELTLTFPFPNIPIKDHLINSVREPIKKLGAEVEVKIDIMNDEERQAFLAMEEKSWKGI